MLDLEKYIPTQRGNIPLILSVPHGGTITLDILPDRTKGVLGTDKATINLTKELINHIEKRNSGKTCFIMSKIHRSKVDLNRSPVHAFPKDSELSKKVYEYFHSNLKELIEYNIQNFKRSLLIDIHGFEKDKRPPNFRDVDIILGTNNLKSLYSHSVPKKNWDKNIRGKLIKELLTLDLEIAPGHPKRKEYVLKGGYITKKYGASSIGRSQAMQIEFSDDIRLYKPGLRNKVLQVISSVLLDEMEGEIDT